MNIALLGYGKMGKTIEGLAKTKNANIVYKHTKTQSEGDLSKADVAIEFSQPDAAMENIAYCLENGIPVGRGGPLGNIPHAKGVLHVKDVHIQALGQAFGGQVVRARKVMHGKTSAIHHRGEGVFAGLSQPFEATRYHSLVVERDSLPDCLEITAWTCNEAGEVDEIMGVRHKTMNVEGVQFHPESVLTPEGDMLMANFIRQEPS